MYLKCHAPLLRKDILVIFTGALIFAFINIGVGHMEYRPQHRHITFIRINVSSCHSENLLLMININFKVQF